VAIISTRAILLRAHPYSESSLVLRFFTEHMGTVGVMAKGARRGRSRGGSGLETFAGGVLTVYVKETRDLQTFKDFEALQHRRGLARHPLRFGGASVAAELVLRHGGESAAPALFEGLEAALDRIDQAPDDAIIEAVLSAGWHLVIGLGYEPVLDPCVECGRPLEDDEVGRFDLHAGGLRCASCSSGKGGPRIGPGARAQLVRLLAGGPDPVTHPRAHLRLLSDFVTYHVSGTRPLESFAFLASLLPAEADDG
jgi:DNA repair protein RecO (recombination protein O)